MSLSLPSNKMVAAGVPFVFFTISVNGGVISGAYCFCGNIFECRATILNCWMWRGYPQWWEQGRLLHMLQLCSSLTLEHVCWIYDLRCRWTCWSKPLLQVIWVRQTTWKLHDGCPLVPFRTG
jgi:hypothetical protein